MKSNDPVFVQFCIKHPAEMKKILLLLSLILIVSSCEKNQFVSENEVPQWLRLRIAADEQKIAEDPHSGLDIAAWIRYKYEGEYYFEYHNLLSSSMPPIYSHDGTTFNYAGTGYLKYQENKCCREYVWKGPAYFTE
mgnify:CR=1 FL=1